MKDKEYRQQKRDIEREREDLLELMKKHVSPELQKKINTAVSIVTKAEHIPIKMSHGGASDAIEE